MQPTPNHVIVKPLYLGEESGVSRQTKSGILIDATHQAELHAPRMGLVIACGELRYCGHEHKRAVRAGSSDAVQRYIRSTTAYDVDVEIRPGDIVYFAYLTESNSKRDGKITEDGNFVVKYQDLYCAVRGAADPQSYVDGEEWEFTEIIPLNGLVFVTPRVYKDKKKGLILYRKDRRKPGEGKIKYLGTLVRDYFMPEASPGSTDLSFSASDDDILCLEDIIYFNPTKVNGLVRSFYEIDPRLKGTIRMHRKDIYAVVQKDKLQPA